ncbi:hypothetical protein [Desulfosarcina variabilis]|uniref:hypothetical protein n=1 Tax=Desulfosarcina variabilis TaxID=2300 RepID=UPI003AFAB314
MLVSFVYQFFPINRLANQAGNRIQKKDFLLQKRPLETIRAHFYIGHFKGADILFIGKDIRDQQPTAVNVSFGPVFLFADHYAGTGNFWKLQPARYQVRNLLDRFFQRSMFRDPQKVDSSIQTIQFFGPLV